MEKIHSRIDNLTGLDNHYLVIGKKNNSSYYRDFVAAAEILSYILTPQEFEHWLSVKMQLKKGTKHFEEKKFIQHAVETSVIRFFAERFPKSFKADAKVNPNNNKDVDCTFTSNGFSYNIEVKCADYTTKETIDAKDGLKLKFAGRFDNTDAITKAFENIIKTNEPLIREKSMDNTLKDFLVSAHNKFASSHKENIVNILVIGCGDEEDMQNWWFYMNGTQGLFTKHSFVDKNSYSNVDLVVLTNLYHVHNKYFDKQVPSNWSLDKTLNLVFGNPFYKLKKQSAIKHLFDIFPNNNTEFESHYNKLLETNEPFLPILNYVRLFLIKEKNENYF